MPDGLTVDYKAEYEKAKKQIKQKDAKIKKLEGEIERLKGQIKYYSDGRLLED